MSSASHTASDDLFAISREHPTLAPRWADAFFDARHAESPTAHDVPGLGQRAFGTDTGDVTVVKDDMTLTVDATALPETFGSNGQKRSAFAFEVAADIMGCWTEHD